MSSSVMISRGRPLMRAALVDEVWQAAMVVRSVTSAHRAAPRRAVALEPNLDWLGRLRPGRIGRKPGPAARPAATAPMPWSAERREIRDFFGLDDLLLLVISVPLCLGCAAVFFPSKTSIPSGKIACVQTKSPIRRTGKKLMPLRHGRSPQAVGDESSHSPKAV